MKTDTEKNSNDSILYYSSKAKYYNELLIEQCKNWKHAEKLQPKKSKFINQ
jgi:hypothetical protein